MSLKQLKKSELQDLANELGLGSIEGTKAVIENKINDHFDAFPELGKTPKYGKYFVYRQKYGSPLKSTRSSMSSPLKTPSKAQPITTTNESDEDSDSDVSDEKVSGEDEDSSEEEGSVIVEENSEESETESSELKDSFLVKAKDFTKEQFESYKSSSCEYTKKFTNCVINKNESLKEILSTPTTIYNLELLVEFLSASKPYVKFVPIYNVAPIAIAEKIPDYIGESRVFDLSHFFKLEHVSILFFWSLISIILPTISSYYINFSKFDTRFDPFTFFVTKGFLNYFFLGTGINIEDINNDLLVSASKASGLKLGITLGDRFKDFIFRNAVVLTHSLGSIPVFGGIAAVLLSIYVAISA